MIPSESSRKRTDSVHSDDIILPSMATSRISRRASRALSINRLSKLMMRDSLSPAPTKEDFLMDAEVAAFKENDFARFTELMHVMDKWLTKYKCIIRLALGALYKTRYFSASYLKIKSLLRNFKAPCNEFEMHVVCRVLDTLEIRRVSYKVFSKRSSHVLLTNGLGLQKLNSATQYSVPDPSISINEMKLFDEEKKFISIMFVYAPFHDILKHPGHFSRVVSLDLYVCNLKEIIERHMGLVSEVEIIFGMRFMEDTSSLPWELTLWELGFSGGCEKFPTTLTLYYNIDTVNRVFDCPLFLTSHYYLHEKENPLTRANKTLTATSKTQL